MRKFARHCLDWCLTNQEQIVRYVITGVVSFVIDYGLFLILFKLADLWYLLASVSSQAMAVIFNFLTNKFWSFKSRSATHREFIRYLTLAGTNYVVQLSILTFLVEAFGIAEWLAKILAIGVVVTWTFLVYKFWVFRQDS